MSNRTPVVARTAIAAFAALFLAFPASAGEAALSSTVDGPKVPIGATAADFAATHSPGAVGAMHYAVAGRATNADEVRREGGSATAGAVRWLPAPAHPAS